MIIISYSLGIEPRRVEEEVIVKDALFQAIALEKLHGVLGCVYNDTIFIYYKGYDQHLLNTVGRYNIIPIDSVQIIANSKDTAFNYINMIIQEVGHKYKVDFIRETSFPQSSDIRLIDRPGLTVLFKFKGLMWEIIDIIRWYG